MLHQFLNLLFSIQLIAYCKIDLSQMHAYEIHQIKADEAKMYHYDLSKYLSKNLYFSNPTYH